MPSTLHLHDAQNTAKNFRTGISLHSHTCHSKESLGFVYRYAERVGILGWAVRRGERQYQQRKGAPLNFARAYWTPPMAPQEAWEVEAAQIRGYGLEPLVSLTDHDTIEAPLTLGSISGFPSVPVSLEWTVPYRGTFFHLGIHNLQPHRAAELMKAFQEFSANPVEARLGELLPAISADPQTLIVFNHPCWDEKEVGFAAHRSAAMDLLREHGQWLHALEVNGLRPWKENQDAVALSECVGKPLISGGDRHALRPNTILNFTNAASFSEFCAEVRAGQSEVAFLPSYGQAFRLRLLHDLQDIISYLPQHGLGWHRWEQRVYFLCEDQHVRSLATIFSGSTPMTIQIFVRAVLGMKSSLCTGVLQRLWGQTDHISLEPTAEYRRRSPAQRRVEAAAGQFSRG